MKSLGLGCDHTFVFSPQGFLLQTCQYDFTVTQSSASKDAHPVAWGHGAVWNLPVPYFWGSSRTSVMPRHKFLRDSSCSRCWAVAILSQTWACASTSYKTNVSLNRKWPVCCNVFNSQFLAYLSLASQDIKLPSFPIGSEGFLQGCQILPVTVPFLPTLFAVAGGGEGKKKRKEKRQGKGDGSQMD